MGWAFRVVGVLLLVLAWVSAHAAELRTKSGERIAGRVLAISEKGVLVQTEAGTRTVLPMEIAELTLDGPWVLAYADGSAKAGRLAVKGGRWFFEGHPLNFYSVYAFTPKARGMLEAFRQGSEAPKASLAAPASDPEAGARGTRAGTRSVRLPTGRVVVEGRPETRGEVLAITPEYLSMAVRGAMVRFTWSQVHAFESPVPWTVVDSQGRRWTGPLRYAEGHWWVGARRLEPPGPVAYVPRLDLLESPAERVRPSSRMSRRAPSPKPAAAPCPKPEDLHANPRTDVSGWPLRAALATGEDFAKNGDLGEAIRIDRLVVRRYASEPEAWLRLASAYRRAALACERAGDADRAAFYFKKAFDAYAEAEKRAPKDSASFKTAAYWRGRTAKEGLWGSEAVEAFEEGIRSFAAKRYEEAVKAFSRAVKKSPRWPEPYYWRARALFMLGRREDAVHALREALKVDPHFQSAQKLLLRLGEVPADAPLEVLLEAAYAQESEGRSDLAEKIYEAVLKRYPKAFLGYYRYALLERKLEHWDRARALLQAALARAKGEDDRKKAAYWLKRVDLDAAYGPLAVDAFEKGYGAYTRGDYADALRAFAQAAKAAPAWADARYWRIRALLKLGRGKEAKAELEAFVRAHPEHEGARALYRSLR